MLYSVFAGILLRVLIMGATSSHHEPLDRNRHGTSFRRAGSLRQSKTKGNRSSPRRMERLRRSFRDSFRRRKEPISEASKPHLWQTDEMDVRSGSCFFQVKYLGCVEVFESRGMQVCEEALKVLKNSRRRPVKAILHVSGDGLRVVEDDTKGLIVDQTIEKVSFCAPDRNHDKGFSYICRDGTTRRWMCHGFLALKESGERLSHAVGCAFAVCLERKQKRDKECSVTMNFDPSTSTFTRSGSFRQQSYTDKLQDTTNVNNNVNTLITTTANSTSNITIPATTVININNNINTNYNRKENRPVRTTPKISTQAIERPHATESMLKRQNSMRGLSHLNHVTPFKRQLSLRISDLPSNVERTRSHSLEYTFDTLAPKAQFLNLKTPVSPIPEVSPNHTTDILLPDANTVTAQVSEMCQQLSQGLSILSNNDDLITPKTDELNSNVKDIFTQKVSKCSSQLIELQPVISQSSSSFVGVKSCLDDNSSSNFEQSLQPSMQELCLQHRDQNILHNNSSRAELSNNSMFSEQLNSVSSVENIPLTPPATPPSPASSVSAQLPKPEQWLGKVAQHTLNIPELSSSATEAVTPAAPSSPPAAKRIPTLALHTRAYSLSSAETVLSRANVEKRSDPFNIDWASLAVEPKPRSKNTNPFLSNSPCSTATDAAVKTFEVKM